jgi:hypothetical protein
MLPSPAWNTLATRNPYFSMISEVSRSTCDSWPSGTVPSMQM